MLSEWDSFIRRRLTIVETMVGRGAHFLPKMGQLGTDFSVFQILHEIFSFQESVTNSYFVLNTELHKKPLCNPHRSHVSA